jgi:hypothetical protein
MYIKITEENLDYINRARLKYADFKYKHPIDISKKFIDVKSLTYDNLSNPNLISFKEFKKLYPLKKINKPIELW